VRIGVIGVGALGSVIGALLHEAGQDVVLVERNQQEVELVREKGLWIEGVSGERVVRPHIVAGGDEAGTIDLALVLVKAYDTAGTLPTLATVLSPEGIVLTLQNGVGNYETLNAAFPDRVLLGTTIMGAMTLGPGRVRHTGFGDTHFGEADGSIRERTQAAEAALGTMRSGPVHAVDNAVGSVWSKLIVNAGINAPATLLRVKNGDLPVSEAGKALIHDVVDECLAVTRAKGIRLMFDDAEARVIAVCHGTAANVCSMFQDMLAGRRTEIDFINGAIAREAEHMGFAAPVNRTLALLIKAMEETASRRVPDPTG
jgi:2-dehydropantoate 2-reductase